MSINKSKIAIIKKTYLKIVLVNLDFYNKTVNSDLRISEKELAEMILRNNLKIIN